MHIDSYTASGSRGSYARLCVQVNLEKPLINMVRIGKCRQIVMYEGISTLCFSCGPLGHTQNKCCYSIKQDDKKGEDNDGEKDQDCSQASQPNPNYGPWMLVTRKRSPIRNGRGLSVGKSILNLEGQKGKNKNQLVEDDVTSKSSFEALEDMTQEDTCVEITYQNQQEILSKGELDMVSTQACQTGSVGEALNKNINKESTFKKGNQVSKSRSKNLGIKNPKTLKCQIAQTGNKNWSNQASPSTMKSQIEDHGNKFPRIDALASV